MALSDSLDFTIVILIDIFLGVFFFHLSRPINFRRFFSDIQIIVLFFTNWLRRSAQSNGVRSQKHSRVYNWFLRACAWIFQKMLIFPSNRLIQIIAQVFPGNINVAKRLKLSRIIWARSTMRAIAEWRPAPYVFSALISHWTSDVRQIHTVPRSLHNCDVWPGRDIRVKFHGWPKRKEISLEILICLNLFCVQGISCGISKNVLILPNNNWLKNFDILSFSTKFTIKTKKIAFFQRLWLKQPFEITSQKFIIKKSPIFFIKLNFQSKNNNKILQTF